MNKKKIALLAMSLCMIAILAVGGSLAYLTDFDHQINVFTTGNVEINLDETEVVENPETGDLESKIENDNQVRTDENQTYDLHPNMYVDKDPTIWVLEGSEPSYIGAIVTVTGRDDKDNDGNLLYNLHDLYALEGMGDMLDIHKLVRGDKGTMIAEATTLGTYGADGLQVFQNENYAVYQKAEKDKNTWTFYVFVKNVKYSGETETLFHKLVVPAEYDNDDMKYLDDLSIDVKAYATQAHGFGKDTNGDDVFELVDDGCYKAMTTAFNVDWPFSDPIDDVESRA